MRYTAVLAPAVFAVALIPVNGAAAPFAPASTVADGVTVTGHGSASEDATLGFSIRLGGKTSAGATPVPGPQNLGDLEGGPRTLAATLTSAGAKQVSITFDATISGNDPYPFEIRGLLEHPTHDRILSLAISGALATLPDGSPIFVQAVSGALVTDDCEGLERRAEAAAYDGALARAKAIAAHAGVKLGAVRSIVVSGAFAGTCPTFENASRGQGFANTLPLDGPYRITVARDVTVTFALR